MFYRHQYRQVITLIVLLASFFVSFSLMAKEASPEFTHSTVDYKVPDVEVIRQDGKKLSLSKEVNDGRPVMLNFIFTSCSAICPMLSHVLSKAQAKLAKEKVHLVSISIDPENDTPAKLSEYAKKFDAGSYWDFYTGTVETSIAIQKAFDAYRGDKMNHTSVIFMRAAPHKPWLRLEGYASPDAVVLEYKNMIKPK
jgi:protein SCO1/2